MEIVKSISVEFASEEREAIGKVAELLEEICNCGDGSGECQGCPLETHCRKRCGTPLYEVLYDILTLEEDGDLGCDSRLV
jgi:hypothetical protein